MNQERLLYCTLSLYRLTITLGHPTFIPEYRIHYKNFFQVPLNIISHGIAFHDHLAIEPESPYYEANYEGIRDMVLNREEILNEAAIGYAAFIGSDTDNAVMELRRKAR